MLSKWAFVPQMSLNIPAWCGFKANPPSEPEQLSDHFLRSLSRKLACPDWAGLPWLLLPLWITFLQPSVQGQSLWLLREGSALLPTRQRQTPFCGGVPSAYSALFCLGMKVSRPGWKLISANWEDISRTCSPLPSATPPNRSLSHSVPQVSRVFGDQYLKNNSASVHCLGHGFLSQNLKWRMLWPSMK